MSISEKNEDYDIIVVGGGPAGMAAALGAVQFTIHNSQCTIEDEGRGGEQFTIETPPSTLHPLNTTLHPQPSILHPQPSILQTPPSGLKVLLIERAPELGGILNQCTHTGFGLTVFGEELTGQEYARRFVERVMSSGIETLADTMVLDISKDRVITLSGKKSGLARVRAKAIVLASGCRERPIGALPVAGTRPAGVYTAGAAQKMINLGGYDIGNRFIILGSGDVGMIVARELALRGKEVVAVIEKEDHCGGLPRNRINCLERFGIPLITRATVSIVHGVGRITGVTIAARGEKQFTINNSQCTIEDEGREGEQLTINNSQCIIEDGGREGEQFTINNSQCIIEDEGREGEQFTINNSQFTIEDEGREGEQLTTHNSQFIPCDTLITSVGLIPERELLDKFEGTLPSWLFLCGNACYVHDVVDDVTVEAERTGAFASEFIRAELIRADDDRARCLPNSERIGENPDARGENPDAKGENPDDKREEKQGNGESWNYKAPELWDIPPSISGPQNTPIENRTGRICVGCPKSCAVTQTADGWQGLACGRPAPQWNT